MESLPDRIAQLLLKFASHWKMSEKKLLSEIGDAIAVDWFCMTKHPNTDCILRVESVVTAKDFIWKWLIDKDNAFVLSTDGVICIM